MWMPADTVDAKPDGDTPVASNSADVLSKLPDAQVFSRDPEDYTQEAIEDTIARLQKIVARQRKARQDDAAIAETLLKVKKANAAATKKKTKATKLLESKV